MPITITAFMRTAQQIHDYLHRLSPRQLKVSEIRKYVYDLLTNRVSEDEALQIYDAYYREKEPQYAATIRSLRFDPTIPFNKKSDGIWYSVSYGETNNYPLFGNYKVKYKEYFTFAPASSSAEKIFTDALKLVLVLPALHQQLYHLTSDGNVPLSIKIPATFYSLLLSIDSIVIHYGRSELGPSIRSTVQNICRHSGVLLGGRNVRVHTGFDFKHVKVNILSYSHSEIVAELVAKEIIQYASVYIQYDVSQLAAAVQIRIKDISHWPIEKVYAAIGDIHV